MIPVTNEAYKLFHEGNIALAQVEDNGMRIDIDYIKTAIDDTTRHIEKLSRKLVKDDIFKTWKKTYGKETNFDSNKQLGKILFDVKKYPCSAYTPSGLPSTTEETLNATGLKFVKRYLKIKKLKKANSTYLKGILRETVNGYVHPFFNLNLVLTYRSSSDSPNFQNIPIRNPEIKKLIRRAFIARKNHQIIEIDFKGAEICCGACYHHDPRMIKYIETNPGKMHTDMAAKAYMLKLKQVTSDTRYCGKNMFVFPQFYGDWYKNCARNLWEAIDKMNLETVQGKCLHRHLKRKGITELGLCDYEIEPEEGTFEEHIKEVEHDFWNKRFKVYNQWKQDWYNEYLEKGYFDTLTGFHIEGLLKRNEVINYPVQGSAFHWLLWSLIQIQKQMNKYKMRSKIVGQIHDSIVGDIHKKEKKQYLEIVQDVIYNKIRKHWDWIIVPLDVECEATPVGGSWYDKSEIKI